MIKSQVKSSRIDFNLNLLTNFAQCVLCNHLWHMQLPRGRQTNPPSVGRPNVHCPQSAVRRLRPRLEADVTWTTSRPGPDSDAFLVHVFAFFIFLTSAGCDCCCCCCCCFGLVCLSDSFECSRYLCFMLKAAEQQPITRNRQMATGDWQRRQHRAWSPVKAMPRLGQLTLLPLLASAPAPASASASATASTCLAAF